MGALPNGSFRIRGRYSAGTLDQSYAERLSMVDASVPPHSVVPVTRYGSPLFSVCDPSGNWLTLSHSWSSLLGWNREELLNSPIPELVHPADVDQALAVCQGADGGGTEPRVIVIRFRRSDGSHAWLRWTVTKDPESGNLVGVAEPLGETPHDSHLDAMRGPFLQLTRALSRAVEIRDPYTAGHQRRVADLSVAISRYLGWDADRAHGLYLGSLLHDLGKLYVPASILNRPGVLTAAEIDIIKAHSVNGQRTISDVEFSWPIQLILRHHHERLDGSGYPDGLRNDEILDEARIVAVADVVDAMSSHRPYRPAIPMAEVLQHLDENRERLYDADVVTAAIALISGQADRDSLRGMPDLPADSAGSHQYGGLPPQRDVIR